MHLLLEECRFSFKLSTQSVRHITSVGVLHKVRTLHPCRIDMIINTLENVTLAIIIYRTQGREYNMPAKRNPLKMFLLFSHSTCISFFSVRQLAGIAGCYWKVQLNVSSLTTYSKGPPRWEKQFIPHPQNILATNLIVCAGDDFFFYFFKS